MSFSLNKPKLDNFAGDYRLPAAHAGGRTPGRVLAAGKGGRGVVERTGPMKNDPAILATPDYRRFIEDLKARVTEARISAARHVNRDLILLYWDIGQAIDEKQKIHNWGDAVVEMVARDLKAAFPGSTGFSPQNVWRMRQFYRDHTDEQFLAQACERIDPTRKADAEG